MMLKILKKLFCSVNKVVLILSFLPIHRFPLCMINWRSSSESVFLLALLLFFHEPIVSCLLLMTLSRTEWMEGMEETEITDRKVKATLVYELEWNKRREWNKQRRLRIKRFKNKLRMAHASTHGARKPPGPKLFNTVLIYEMRMTRRRKLKEQNKSFYEIIREIWE